MKRAHTGSSCRALALVPLVAALGLASAPVAAQEAVDAEVEVEGETHQVRTEDPGFRTDLGLHLSLGGHACLPGGSRYAKCNGQDVSWDPSLGFNVGLIVRPFQRLSFGLDFSYMRMVHHQDTASKWSDLILGPVARYHHPLRIRDLYFEPNVGVGFGWVKANYHQAERIDTQEKVDFDHAHLGAVLTILLGADFFPLPRLGVGIEFRLIRTFYDEVCFEWNNGVNCRGSRDEAIVRRWADDNVTFPGEKGIADYPWKLFWGVHGLYYF
jgi:hypothetical protein